jgi:hypothetical protein
MRPPPEGALYHRLASERFDEVLEHVLAGGAQAVVLPRTDTQRDRYAGRAAVPAHAVDGRSLLALADAFVGGGGTMTREAALLGTPAYTVFAGELAAVDAELIRRGLLSDLRTGALPAFGKKGPTERAATPEAARLLSDAIVAATRAAARDSRRPSSRARRRV